MAPPADAAATTDDDSRLMARVHAGDETALGELMGRWERPVKAVIGRIVLNTRDADELAQETFVRLWEQRSRFRDDAPFRPWIFAIAVNLARNRLRWWRRRPEVALEEWTEMPGSTGDGADQAERIERAQAVQAAIASLPPDLREALVLAEYENLSHAEIAAIAGTTAKAIESRLARARARLRSSLAAWLR